MFKYIKKLVKVFIQDINLRNKFLLSYFFLIVLPMALITYFSYKKSSRILEDNMKIIAGQSMEQAAASISDKLDDGVNVTNIIAFNTDIQKIMSKKSDNYAIYDQAQDVTTIRSIINNLQDSQSIYRIKIYTNSDFGYSNERSNIFPVNDISNTLWYKTAIEYDGRVLWQNAHLFKYAGINDEKEIVSCVKLIKNYMYSGEMLGIVCADMPVDQFADVLKKYNAFKNGFLYVVDKENNDVFGVINRGAKDSTPFQAMESVLASEDYTNWKELRLAGKSYLVSSKTISNSQWKIVSIIPLDQILESNRSIRSYFFLLTFIGAVTSYLLAYLISLSMSSRIGKLISVMRKAKYGELPDNVLVEGKDEIGELQENFSKMLQRISTLLDEKYRMGQELKNAELKALQAQINPHFLYNTLELIHWKAIKQKSYDISFLISALASFYKLSLSKGRTIVSVAQEIEHAELYIQIQNKRFNDAIIIEKDVDEAILDYSIPKLVLQPLVENSIMHGIMENQVPKGIIMISCRMEDDTVIIEVSDDGIGMEEEKIKQLMNGFESDGEHGYGIGNVDKRLKMYYGEQYGLSYRSIPGQGTTVKIRIPAVNPS